jgi:endonuclease YncB( thermonuclease family)
MTVRNIKLKSIVLALVTLVACSPPSPDTRPAAPTPLEVLPEAPRFSATVTNIVDGDTIDVRDEKGNSYRIRLKGIDSPEKQQAFGYDARQNLTSLIAGRTVGIEWQKIDMHNRIVAKVSLDSVDVCLEQIKGGLAWHFKQFEDEQSEIDQKLYSDTEAEAKTAERGLWRDPSPVPPWEFRHGHITETGKSETNINSTPNPDHTTTISGQIWGNRRTMIYQWPGCPYYYQISSQNRIMFSSREEAEEAGYRAARNCPR